MDVIPELSKLISNCAWLKDLNCTDILKIARFWPAINDSNKNMFNLQVKKLVVHIAAQIKLKQAIQDPTSMIGDIAKLMTKNDHILCQCQGLETYDVLNAIEIETYDKDESFETNMERITKAQKYKLNTNELLIQKLNNVFQYEFGFFNRIKYCFTPMKRKQWHDSAHNLVPGRFPKAQERLIPEPQTGFLYDERNNFDFESIERDAFSLVINAQQTRTPQDITTETAHTAVVVVTTHGQYMCSSPKKSPQNIAMYTIPQGKTLTIVSVATPTSVDINHYGAIKYHVIDGLRSLVSDLNMKNQFIDPITTATKYLDVIVKLKRYFRQLKHLNPLTGEVIYNDNYLNNYTDPRVLAFNEFDDCIDKEYTFNRGREHDEHETQLLKLNFSGWDQELLPGNNCYNYSLSRLCDYLFNVENHKNILVFDFSCSINNDIIEPNQIKTRALDLHLNGGHQ